jgi:hypothetical protein
LKLSFSSFDVMNVGRNHQFTVNIPFLSALEMTIHFQTVIEKLSNDIRFYHSLGHNPHIIHEIKSGSLRESLPFLTAPEPFVHHHRYTSSRPGKPGTRVAMTMAWRAEKNPSPPLGR